MIKTMSTNDKPRKSQILYKVAKLQNTSASTKLHFRYHSYTFIVPQNQTILKDEI